MYLRLNPERLASDLLFYVRRVAEASGGVFLVT